MRNNDKIFRSVTNGMLLAALAAIGIAAFQFGTSTTENTPDEILISEVDPNGGADSNAEAAPDEEAEGAVDVGNSNVTAELENGVPTEDGRDADVTEDASRNAQAADAEASAGSPANLQETAASVYHSPEAIHFSENTAMVWPVIGNVVLDYNMKQTVYFPTLDQYKCNPSICVQAEEGDPVRAAASGKVLAIANDARTGTTVTMELGDSYQAVYGQLKDLTVSEGELVEEGTVIGYVAAPTKYYTEEGTNLYFAMRKNGEPIDPILYLP